MERKGNEINEPLSFYILDSSNHSIRPGAHQGHLDPSRALLRGGRNDDRRGRVRAEHRALPDEQIVQARSQHGSQLYLPASVRAVGGQAAAAPAATAAILLSGRSYASLLAAAPAAAAAPRPCTQ